MCCYLSPSCHHSVQESLPVLPRMLRPWWGEEQPQKIHGKSPVWCAKGHESTWTSVLWLWSNASRKLPGPAKVAEQADTKKMTQIKNTSFRMVFLKDLESKDSLRHDRKQVCLWDSTRGFYRCEKSPEKQTLPSKSTSAHIPKGASNPCESCIRTGCPTSIGASTTFRGPSAALFAWQGNYGRNQIQRFVGKHCNLYLMTMTLWVESGKRCFWPQYWAKGPRARLSPIPGQPKPISLHHSRPTKEKLGIHRTGTAAQKMSHFGVAMTCHHGKLKCTPMSDVISQASNGSLPSHVKGTSLSCFLASRWPGE